jgi:hypothetical protein
MKPEEIKEALSQHKQWLQDPTKGTRLDLNGANLSGADLYGADLSRAYLGGASLVGASLVGANLRGAYLNGANLSYANLRNADLRNADLRGADLYGANLSGAYLSYANLSGAYLSDANLSYANLRYANLSGAYLSDANLGGAVGLLTLATPPEAGAFVAFKKVHGAVLKLEISGGRTGSYVGRKCRAERAKVIEVVKQLEGYDPEALRSFKDPGFVYRINETVTVPGWDPDKRIECAPGIHFFMTQAEAEDFEW